MSGIRGRCVSKDKKHFLKRLMQLAKKLFMVIEYPAELSGIENE
jgi:hypothetical protein